MASTKKNKDPDTESLSDPCICTQEDFIIFAEFSEVTGPIPLLTIPTYIEDSDIDLNSIILRIMSVDYQANSGGPFTLCQDAQVVRPEVLPGIYAYVHYLTLQDLQARGFVRPLCMAYLTPDRLKLDSILIELREHFLQTTHIMKFNNRQWFMEELCKALHNLKQTQTKYFYLKQLANTLVVLSSTAEDGEIEVRISREEEGILPLTPEEKMELNKMDISQLVHQYTEYIHMQHVVEPHLCDEESRALVNSWKCELVLKESSLPQVESFLSQLKRDRLDKAGGKGLCSVLALSPWGSAAALWRMICALRQYCHCSMERELTMFPQEKAQAEASESVSDFVEQALSDSEYLQVLSSLANPKESCTSPTSSVRKSFTLVAKQEASFELKQSNSGDDLSSDSVAHDALEYMEANYLSTGTEGSSYHSLPESISPSPYTAHADSNLPVDGSSEEGSEGFVDVSDECVSADSWIVGAPSSHSFPHKQPRQTQGLLRGGILPGLPDEEHAPRQKVGPLVTSGSGWLSRGGAHLKPSELPTLTRCYPLIYQSLRSHQILRFFQSFNKAAHHVVYSLLIGRTVVLCGTERSICKVSRIITALKALIPVKEGGKPNVIRWHCGILVTSHIVNNQIIGLCVPERLSVYDMISHKDKLNFFLLPQNSVTILNVKSKQLFGPAYSGRLLASLETIPQLQTCDQSLLLYLQVISITLQEKVFVLRSLAGLEPNTNKIRNTLKQMDLKGCDGEVVKYLSSILPSIELI
uniref:UDENN FLCN/SMCR8-type domain-containing protein n=1 Tax=Timema genevievae TaxID=629358 RepID=A0A7R9PKD3_TIMGE|nr:unnamed protein product [Timema genevievae]